MSAKFVFGLCGPLFPVFSVEKTLFPFASTSIHQSAERPRRIVPVASLWKVCVRSASARVGCLPNRGRKSIAPFRSLTFFVCPLNSAFHSSERILQDTFVPRPGLIAKSVIVIFPLILPQAIVRSEVFPGGHSSGRNLWMIRFFPGRSFFTMLKPRVLYGA